MKSSWSVFLVLACSAVVALGCSVNPVKARATPGTLKVRVTSVTGTLEPYNPQISNHGIPAELVNFTVSGLPTSSATSYLHCEIRVLRSGRQVGATSVVSGASSSQSVSVEVNGDTFPGQPSDAHVVCHRSASPLLR